MKNGEYAKFNTVSRNLEAEKMNSHNAARSIDRTALGEEVRQRSVNFESPEKISLDVGMRIRTKLSQIYSRGSCSW